MCRFHEEKLLHEAASNLFQSILMPNLSSSNEENVADGDNRCIRLSSDRVDSLGGALFIFLVLDMTSFQSDAQRLISMQPINLQPTFMRCIDRLLTARNINFQNIDKPNKMLFVQNFREFAVQIRSLTLKNNLM